MLAPAFEEVLRSQRDFFNTRFAAARRRWPHLDAADFTLFLRDRLAPLIAAVAANSPEQTLTVARDGYDLGLQLVAEKLAGPSAHHAGLNDLWSAVFPRLAGLIATQPRHLLGSLCNAAHQLAVEPHTRPEFWRARLSELGPRCTDAEQLLPLAQLLAWRAGLAHYRTSALQIGSHLPEALALAAVNAPRSANWSAVQAAYLRDPWYRPDAADITSAPTNEPRRIGSFQGFGGLFIAPPLVSITGEHLLVRSGDGAWLLVADAYGATFHRASPAELSAALSPSTSRHGIASAALPPGHQLTSCTVLGTTIAFTSDQSHAVWIGPTHRS